MKALACHVSRDGLNTVVRLEGELDIATHDLLVATAGSCITHGATCTLDCTRVTFMDSTGLHALLVLQRIAHEHGAVLHLAAPPRAMTKVLQLAGLSSYFTITRIPALA